MACHGDWATGSSSREVEAHVGMSPLGSCQKPYHTAFRLQDWVASGQTISREGAQPHSSADNWIEGLLSMALPTRAR